MENPNSEELNLKVFNAAKLIAEKSMFMKMDLFQRYQRQADFGCEDLNTSLEIPEEIRDIQRFNGLKAMNDIVYNLLISISSTVKLKNNKEENTQLKKLSDVIEKIKLIFYEHKERFFKSTYKETSTIEILDREYFNKIRKIIDTCYINIEILMTRNKLLFADANDEFKSDREIMDEIKKEYIDG